MNLMPKESRETHALTPIFMSFHTAAQGGAGGALVVKEGVGAIFMSNASITRDSKVQYFGIYADVILIVE